MNPTLRSNARLLLGLVLAVGLGAARAAELERIRWVVSDNPPLFNLVGGKPPLKVADLGQGELDGMLRLLVERMPQFQHEFIVAENTRLEALVREGEPICSNLLLKTPARLDWLYFTHSHPVLQSRQVHLVTRAELRSRLERKGQAMELTQLLRHPEFKGLLERDRSYGARIDGVLQEQGELLRKQALVRHGNNLLRMVRMGRKDYTFEYGVVVDEFQRAEPRGAALVALPLNDTQSTARATLACARNPAGRRHIEAIDAAVRQLAREGKREDWMRSWLGQPPPARDQARVKRYMDERAKNGPQIE